MPQLPSIPMPNRAAKQSNLKISFIDSPKITERDIQKLDEQATSDLRVTKTVDGPIQKDNQPILSFDQKYELE